MHTSPPSLQTQIWQKLQRLPENQQQTLLSFLDFLLFQLEELPSSDLSETCGAWQNDPRDADDLINEIYATRSASTRDYSL
ncbi:MAG: DUF2281 domain-containing protein [Synechococcaceae cyanobacterium RL_1_2]|nr:DUF2281 domain-containing protein [Synechococcaceae cyanobacterium RL_1_2]